MLPYLVMISLMSGCNSIEITTLYRPHPGSGYWTNEDEIQAQSPPKSEIPSDLSFSDDEEIRDTKNSLVEAQKEVPSKKQEKPTTEKPKAEESAIGAKNTMKVQAQESSNVTSKKKQEPGPVSSKGNQLTLDQDLWRSELISEVQYQFTLALPKGIVLWRGTSELHIEEKLNREGRNIVPRLCWYPSKQPVRQR